MTDGPLFPWSVCDTTAAGDLAPDVVGQIERALSFIHRVDPDEVARAFVATHLTINDRVYLRSVYLRSGDREAAPCACGFGALYAVAHGLALDEIDTRASDQRVREWAEAQTGSELYRDAFDYGFSRIASATHMQNATDPLVLAISCAGLLDGARAREAAEAAVRAYLEAPRLFAVAPETSDGR